MAAGDVLCFESLSKTLSELSISFFQNGNKPTYEEYIGYEKICEEIKQLHIPMKSDILNIAAGPGLISAKLQLMGYDNLDALDSDFSTIVKLRESGLYRHCICRSLNKLNSTGLNEDTYDTIVMAGGFRPDKIPTYGFDELLRITRPDGCIIFTLREDYLNRVTDFALLEENLISFAKSGRCEVLTLGAPFVDSHSGLSGRLYVIIKKALTRNFEPRIPRAAPTILADAVRVENEEDLNEHIQDDLIMVGRETGVTRLCKALFSLGLNRNKTEILDLSFVDPLLHRSHRTSCVGANLSENGYVMVDILHCNLKFLNDCRKKEIYRNYILGNVHQIGSIPVNNESYDVIVMFDGFTPGKVLPSSFPEIVRVLRPGGYFLFMMRDEYRHSDPELSLLDKQLGDLIKDKKLKVIVGPVTFEKFDGSSKGSFYVLRKCGNEIFALGSPRHSPNSSPVMRRKYNLSKLL